MARYRVVDRSPKFIPVVLDAQIQPGSFEYALDYLVDHELDLGALHARYNNDVTGAPAYDPAVLLKIVLLAYSRGLISSRSIERACRENVLFMALSGDSAPQFTTIAKFIRELGGEIQTLFTQVLLTCDAQGLIGKQMFAIDGVKLSSNASKERSGSFAELAHEADRMERAVHKMITAHQRRDSAPADEDDAGLNMKRVTQLQGEAARIRDFLARNTERKSAKGSIRKSNVTDNDSAKMATSKGVIQGYTAVAAVDSAHQVIVAAVAHGSGSEQSTLVPTVALTDALRKPHAVFGRTTPNIAINCLRAIHRFDSANSVTTCAVFLAKPRNRTFTKPNCRLMTRNGCSTFARTLALRCSCFWTRALALALRQLGDVAGPRGDVPLQIVALHARLGAPR
jgi:transposase